MKRIPLALAAICSVPAWAADSASFNPDTSLILQGRYLTAKDIEERQISGFLPAGLHDHGSGRGFSLDHTELTFSSNVDHAFRAYANFAIADEVVEVEEAWFQTLALDHGFTVKGGRFLSGIGYSNEHHPHAWDFADQSLMGKVLFGAHLIQDGVQAKWLAPTATFLEFGVEAARGQNFPGSEAGADKNGAGSWSAFTHIGNDLGDSHSWRTGIAYLHAAPQERESHLEDVNEVEALSLFSGDSKTWIADFVWKWAPDGNSRERNFKLQAEYFQRTESGDLTCEDNSIDELGNPTGGACDGTIGTYEAKQSGYYAQVVYQFIPRWRAGYRYDWLDSGDVTFGANAGMLEPTDYHPTRHSMMVDYSPSEFSRLRLQLAQDKSMQEVTDNQVTLQYVMSIGPHGAHKF
ncbi:MAG TPA: TonB-dependent receptor [Gammaproteobacteria bacterium]